jgi:hypothetical protein
MVSNGRNNMKDADKMVRYAKTIQRMAVNAPFDFEDRELLRQLAEEIQAERELELQERLIPAIDSTEEVMEYAV